MKTILKDQMTATLYLKVFIALLLLTILTFLQPIIITSTIQNTVLIHIFLAIIKTIFIVSYYMHLKYETKLFKYILLMAVVTLGIFFIITATDAVFRNESFDLFKVGE